MDSKPFLEHFWQTGQIISIPGIDWSDDLINDIWSKIQYIRQLYHEIDTIDYQARLSGYMAEDTRSKMNRISLIITNACLAVSHGAERRRYGGLSLDHIQPASSRFLVILALPQFIQQEQFNHLTLAGTGYLYDGPIHPSPQMDSWLKQQIPLLGTGREKPVPTQFQTRGSEIRLAEAFANQMIQEASGKMPIMGDFVMQHVPLPLLDSEVIYSELRLSISYQGIGCSIVNHQTQTYCPFWWSPADRGIPPISIGERLSWVLHVLMACIWRDTCIVRHKALSIRSRSEYTPARTRRQRRATIILPRTVYHVEWSSDEERERILRSTHNVRGHYRELPLDWQTSDTARQNAELYGFPRPPDGFTFVVPHVRGQGEPPAQEPYRVICKGLQVARIALASLADINN